MTQEARQRELRAAFDKGARWMWQHGIYRGTPSWPGEIPLAKAAAAEYPITTTKLRTFRQGDFEYRVKDGCIERSWQGKAWQPYASPKERDLFQGLADLLANPTEEVVE